MTQLESSPFEAGPYPWISKAAPFQFVTQAWRRALATALVLWLPLAVLTAFRGSIFSSNLDQSLLLDLRAHVRYLVAAPLFVWAASIYLPQLGWAVRAFVEAGIIAKHDLDRYAALVLSTRRLLASRVTDAAILCFAYVLTFTGSRSIYPETVMWATSAGGLTPAGWWRMLVSQPLFLALWAVWLWRLLLWARFLWTVSRLDLRLVAGHPDRLGGLRFVLIPLRGFAILAFALGAVSAGTVGAEVIVEGRLALEFRFFIVAHAIAVFVLFTGPLLPLLIPLLRLQARGITEYGGLASRLGRQFEKRWIDAGRRDVDSEALAAADFSATTDLFGIVANAQSINPLMLSVREVLMLLVAALLPFVPIVFFVVPLDRLVQLAFEALI